MLKIKNLGLFIALIFCCSACVDDEDMPIWGDLDEQIFVLNEGNFGTGNGSITAINNDSGETWENIFELVNEFQLGDVVQSMSVHDDKAYIVVNNSGKIEVADATTLESLATIDNLPSPRYFLGIDSDKAYVTNFVFGGTTTLDVIDLNTYEVTKSIPTGWGEQMVQAGKFVFVAIMNSREVLAIDTDTDTVIDTISVAYAPNSMQKDAVGNIWVLSDGGFYGEDIPALQRIDPTTMTIAQTLEFPVGAFPSKLTAAGDQLYYLDAGDVWTLNINGNLSTAPLIASPDYSFYGLGIDPINGDIYASDAGNFTVSGTVLRYDNDGNFIENYSVGVAPGAFYFN